MSERTLKLFVERRPPDTKHSLKAVAMAVPYSILVTKFYVFACIALNPGVETFVAVGADLELPGRSNEVQHLQFQVFAVFIPILVTSIFEMLKLKHSVLAASGKISSAVKTSPDLELLVWRDRTLCPRAVRALHSVSIFRAASKQNIFLESRLTQDS